MKSSSLLHGLAASALIGGCGGTDASAPPQRGPATNDSSSIGGAGISAGGTANGSTGTPQGGPIEPQGLGGAEAGGTGGAPPVGGSAGFEAVGGAGGVFAVGGTTAGGSGGLESGGAAGTGGTASAIPFDAGSDPDRNRVEAGQVCDRLATIQCAGEAACCTSPGRTFDQCKAAQLAQCRNDYFLDAVSLDSVSGYSIDAAEAAFAEFENRASTCDPSIASWAISPTGLRGITQGTLGPGDNCTPPLDFSTATAAAYLAGCTDGANQACLPGVGGTVWTCSPRAPSGSACFSDLNCLDGHYCDNFSNPPALTGSTCIARKQEGAPCAHGQECLTLTCEGGTCVPATAQTAYCLL
jgi:hypothetical protein